MSTSTHSVPNSASSPKSVIRTCSGRAYATNLPITHAVIGVGDINLPGVKLIIVESSVIPNESMTKEILIPVTAIECIETWINKKDGI